MHLSKKIGILLAVISFCIFILIDDLDPAKPQLNTMAAIASFMAILWITEAIPLAVTSLIPLIFFPLTGIISSDEIASYYMNSIILLFLGGFLIAIAMEEWNLHKRIALKIITIFGGSPQSLILGFMFSAALISMWISNTATALMILPIGLSVINKLEDEFGKERTHNFSVVLLLTIAYSCSLGGIATIIGTPPNLVMIKLLNVLFPKAPQISFGNWMLFALPISILMSCSVAILLTKFLFKVDKEIKLQKSFIKKEYKELGKMTFEEKIVGIIFITTAVLWIFRSDINFGFATIPGWSNLFSTSRYIDDGTVAITMAFLLFIIPSRTKKTSILDHTAFNKIPWGIILLFGGGFALAKGFTSTGLSDFIGERLSGLSFVSPLIIIMMTATLVTFLTELTSNTALTQTILPIVASVSVALGINPLLLMLTATLSASMAFMLPVATPPNTIIFAGGRLKIIDMVKAGFFLNLIGVIIISLSVYLLGDLIFGFNTFPEWAKP